MTIAVTNLLAGPFTVSGADQNLPFTFKVFTAPEIKVFQIVGGAEVVIDQDAYTVNMNEAVDGSRIEGGSVDFDAGVLNVANGAVYLRGTPKNTQEQQWSDTGSRLKNVEIGLDRAALVSIAQQNELDGKLSAPLIPAPGAYLAYDAEGNIVPSAGTGADAGLRTDLAALGGAALVGTATGLSVQKRLDILNGFAADYAFNNPPFATTAMDFGSVRPTASTPIAAIRMATDFIMVRVLRDWGSPVAIDEYIYRKVTGSNFDGGWVLWGWRCFAFGAVWPILRQPLDVGQSTANELAFRLGLIGTDVYPTDYAFGDVNGLGPHGNMSGSGTKDFRLNGGGANLEPVAAWPVGTPKFGTQFSMAEDYNMKYRGATSSPGTNAATLNVLRTFNTDYGSFETFTFVATVANLGFQDSPAPMMATNFGGPFDRAKIDNNPLVVPIVGSGGQKGNWRVTGLKSGTARFYPSFFPYIAPTVQAFRGPMVGKGAPNYTDLAPYAGNRFGLWHVTDDAVFAKLTGYMVSAEEAMPRNAEPLPLGVSFQAFTARGTENFPGGLPVS